MEFPRVPSEVLAGLEPIVRHDIAWWEAVLTAFCGATLEGVLLGDHVPTRAYTFDELASAYNSFYHPDAPWNGAIRDGQPALWVASDDQLGQIGSRVGNRILLSREGAKLLRFVLAANKKDRQVRRTDEEFAELRTAFEQEQLEVDARVRGLEAQLLGDEGALPALLRIVGEYHNRPAEEIARVKLITLQDSNATWDLCTALYQALRRREAQDAGRHDTDDSSECLACGESHPHGLTKKSMEGFEESLGEFIEESLKVIMGDAPDLDRRRRTDGSASSGIREALDRVFGSTR